MNRELKRSIENLRNLRTRWVEILLTTPDSVQAAQHILSINCKIEHLRNMWNWADDSVEFPTKEQA